MAAGFFRTALLIPAAVLLGAAAARGEAEPASPLLFPIPHKIEPSSGSFTLEGASVQATDPGAKAAARRLAELLRRSGQPALGSTSAGKIRFVRDSAIASPEGYRLSVTAAGVSIAASGDAGLYYGAQTLWQLVLQAQDGKIPALTIEDAPQYAWRGTMLDSARHMQSPAFIRQLLDRMALVGLNRFHWHLTDDQGWRIPIPAYPRLTQVGAWRQQAGAAGFDPKTGQRVRYGGFYSAQDIRSIVAYAKARHIEVVPEIDFPGHGTAAIAAYPWLASNFDPPAVPSPDWGVLHNIIDPDEQGLKFARDVLDEVMRLFPGQVIHIGGDEAVKDYWNANPKIQAQMRALGLKDAEALQGWFVAQLGDHAAKQGRRIVGWDEILDGEVPGDAMVMSWRGAKGALAAARKGHDAILAPAPDYYVDNKQSDSDAEPPGRGLVISWRRLYEFDPGLSDLTQDERQRIIGLQANLWTEHVRTEAFAEAMLWPRAAILGQLGWSGRQGDWDSFAPRLLWQMEREAGIGFASNRISLDPLARFDAGADGRIAVTLSQPATVGEMRFTVDGSAPSASSPRYDGALHLEQGTRLRARAFLGGRALGKEGDWRIHNGLSRTRAGNDLAACNPGVELRMEDDAPTNGRRLVHQANIMEACWIWPKAPLAGVARITAQVGTRPFNFALSHDTGKIVRGKPETPEGELVIQLDGCAGPVIARLPLAPRAGRLGVGTLAGSLVSPLSGTHDLCISFARPRTDPLWVLDRLTLEP